MILSLFYFQFMISTSFTSEVKGLYGKQSPAVVKENQKRLLKYLWFAAYARERGGARGSSGFKHVFCQELVYKVIFIRLSLCIGRISLPDKY